MFTEKEVQAVEVSTRLTASRNIFSVQLGTYSTEKIRLWIVVVGVKVRVSVCQVVFVTIVPNVSNTALLFCEIWVPVVTAGRLPLIPYKAKPPQSWS